jgi:hypothetical protein
MEKEDYKLLPLVAIGLIRGIGEVFLKPLVERVIPKFPVPNQEEIDHLIQEASIQYYQTPPK